jgi:hypothetical protein
VCRPHLAPNLREGVASRSRRCFSYFADALQRASQDETYVVVLQKGHPCDGTHVIGPMHLSIVTPIVVLLLAAAASYAITRPIGDLRSALCL